MVLLFPCPLLSLKERYLAFLPRNIAVDLVPSVLYLLPLFPLTVLSLSTKMQHDVSFLVKKYPLILFAFKFPIYLFHNVTEFLEKQIYPDVSIYSLPALSLALLDPHLLAVLLSEIHHVLMALDSIHPPWSLSKTGILWHALLAITKQNLSFIFHRRKL
jgi:hypothetical protein